MKTAVMAVQLLLLSAGTTLLLIIPIFITRRLRLSKTIQAATGKKSDLQGITSSHDEPSMLCRELISALPGNVILPRDATAFKQSMTSYWA